MSDTLEPLTVTTEVLGRPHEHHAVLTSTNARAAQWAAEGAPHGAMVTADEQTAGRGRLGRTWYSPAGQSLYTSLVVRPSAGAMDLGPLSLAVGLGLRDGMLACGVPDPLLKWPNDVLIDGFKVAGILCEARWASSAPEITIGFGVNVHNTGFPAALARRATSLALVMDDPPGRATLLTAILEGLEPVLAAFLSHGFSGIKARYLDACVTLGRAVRVGNRENPGMAVPAMAQRIDDSGALWVRPDDGGPSTKVQSADVWLAPTPSDTDDP
ncbi:MAG: biotin--[acetyl-CoA-carboxylase] ligase [Myxococcota bacterium]